MTDFEKIIKDTPQGMEREEQVRTIQDHIAMDPEMLRFYIASFFAQEIAIKIPSMYAEATKQFEEMTGLKPEPLTVLAAIGAVRALAGALALEFIQAAGDDKIERALCVMLDGKSYDALVEPLAKKFGEWRKIS